MSATRRLPRRVTGLFFLPAVATDCPVDWTPSPVSLTCFLVPPERSTSLFRCVDLCEEHGGTPACIGSVEENDFVMELAANGYIPKLAIYTHVT